MKKNLTKALKIGTVSLILGGFLLAVMPRSFGSIRTDDPPGGGGTLPMPKPLPPVKLTDDPPGGGGTLPMPKPLPPTK